MGMRMGMGGNWEFLDGKNVMGFQMGMGIGWE